MRFDRRPHVSCLGRRGAAVLLWLLPAIVAMLVASDPHGPNHPLETGPPLAEGPEAVLENLSGPQIAMITFVVMTPVGLLGFLVWPSRSRGQGRT